MVIGMDEGWFNWGAIKDQLKPSKFHLKIIFAIFLIASFLSIVVFIANKNAENEIYSLSKSKVSRIYPVLDGSIKSVEKDVKSIDVKHDIGCKKIDEKVKNLISQNLFLSKIKIFDVKNGYIKCTSENENINDLHEVTGSLSKTGWRWEHHKQNDEPSLSYLWRIDENYYGLALVNIDLLKKTLQLVSGGVTSKISIHIGDSTIKYDGAKFGLVDRESSISPIEIRQGNGKLSVSAFPEKEYKSTIILSALPYISAIAAIGVILLVILVLYFMHENVAFRRDVLIGIKKGHFIPFYQKIVGPDRNVCAVEVLLRWKKNGNTLLGPMEFIDRADKLGLLSTIVESTMLKVINDLPAMSLPTGTVISINLTPLQVNDQTIFAKIEYFNQKLSETGYRCMIEITEEGLLTDRWVAESLIKKIRAIGVDVAIDDFGVGNSSLSYIQNYDFNVVKIDRIFIADIHRNERNLSIVKGLISIAKDLGMTVVAEGIEHEAQVRVLNMLGVDKLQGFLFHRPAPIEKISNTTN